VAWISKAKDERRLDSAFSLTYVFHEQLDDGDFGIALATGHDDRRGAVAELDDNILGVNLNVDMLPLFFHSCGSSVIKATVLLVCR
jgi:hypothetical protein